MSTKTSRLNYLAERHSFISYPYIINFNLKQIVTCYELELKRSDVIVLRNKHIVIKTNVSQSVLERSVLSEAN